MGRIVSKCLEPRSAKKYRSKTGNLSKFLILIGIIFLIFFIINKTTQFFNFEENINDILIAFCIIFIGSGLLVYFLSYQFSKLAKIAEEIENDNEIKTQI